MLTNSRLWNASKFFWAQQGPLCLSERLMGSRFTHRRFWHRSSSFNWRPSSIQPCQDEWQSRGSFGLNRRWYGSYGRSPYEVLGVSPSASKKEIKSAYKKLALKYHPDRQANASQAERQEAEKKFKEISAAYSQLTSGETEGGPGFGFQNAQGFDFSDAENLFRNLFTKEEIEQLMREAARASKHGGGSGSYSFHSTNFHPGNVEDMFQQMFQGGMKPRYSGSRSRAPVSKRVMTYEDFDPNGRRIVRVETRTQYSDGTEEVEVQTSYADEHQNQSFRNNFFGGEKEFSNEGTENSNMNHNQQTYFSNKQPGIGATFIQIVKIISASTLGIVASIIAGSAFLLGSFTYLISRKVGDTVRRITRSFK